MAHVHSLTGKKISLALSPDDIGVHFSTPESAAEALRSVRTNVKKQAAHGASHRAAPRHFGRTVLLHERGAARTAASTIQNALSARAVKQVRRTLPVYVEHHTQLRVVVTREINVRFKAKVTKSQRLRVLKSLNLRILAPNEFHPDHYLLVPTNDIDESETIDLANKLNERPEVEHAAPNFLSEHRKYVRLDDPLLSHQWHLNNAGHHRALAGEDVKAFAAWDITRGERKVVIALVDDGVDIDHPDLQANIWVNPKAGAPDRNGRDFFDNDFNPRPRYFKKPFDNAITNDIHGTACAGVAAAVGNNKAGVVGVANACAILPVKVFGGDGLFPNDRMANAIRYAGQHADVISISWGMPRNPDVESAINDVVKTGRRGKGCLVFVAGGNEHAPRMGFPANYPLAMGVGASNDRGELTKYSNWGKGLQFVTPSDDPRRHRQGISTTDVSKRNRGFTKGLYTNNFGGTSSAAPLAAGIAALVLSVDPTLSWKQVRSVLRSTADKIDSGAAYRKGYNIHYGYGRLNAFKAVKRAAAAKKSRNWRVAAQRDKGSGKKTTRKKQ
ncbi:MAG TPA: S8 family serine peptidase [Pyrinomonadaceae bacterium]|nr:S8 family serine peptidase [Pyrinomonadaceae bacterium]